jgi:hypothetical protein
MDKYYQKYLKYKQKYFKIKNLIGGAIVTENINKKSEIEHILAQNEGEEYNIDNIQKYFIDNINNYGVILDTPSSGYKKNRYVHTQTIKKNGEISYYQNPDITLEFQQQQPNKYFIDVNLNRLNKNSSDGSTEWISYNWALTKSPDSNYHLIFSESNNDSSEIGIKHSIIASPNKLLFSGEARIINSGSKTIYQFNRNSSSAPSYTFSSMIYETVDKFQNIKIKKILNLFITDPSKEEIQLVEYEPFIAKGLNSSRGLLYYYISQDNVLDNKTKINSLAQKIHDYNKTVTDDKKFLFTPLIPNIYENNNLIYIQIDPTNNITLEKDGSEYNFKINQKLKNLSYLDELFMKLALNKTIDIFGTTRRFDFGKIDIDLALHEPSYESVNYEKKIFDNSELKKFLSQYKNNLCEIRDSIIYSPNDIHLDCVKCWRRAAGSGSILIQVGRKIVKTYNITDDNNIKFWAEGWCSDYIQRKISNYRNPNGTKVTDNFVKFYDIFQCPIKLNIDSNEDCNDYTKFVGNHGYISMEKIDYTLKDLPGNDYDCGLLFEYLYGKLVAFKLGNLIFTDQLNPANCGVKKVDFNRKYKINYGGSSLEIYVTSDLMIKIFDFDNFALTNIGNNYFSDEKDTLADGSPVQGKIKSSELANFNEIIRLIRKSYRENNQIQKFFEIINTKIPASYKVVPSNGKRIESYEFTII